MVKKTKKKVKRSKRGIGGDKSVREASRALKDVGLPYPDKPPFDVPAVPGDITKLTSVKLGKLYSQMVAYVDYGGCELSKLNIQLSNNTLKRKNVAMRVRASSGSDMAKWRLEEAIEQEYTLKGLEKERTEVSAMKEALRSVVDGFEIKAKALSREMSRRETEKLHTRT